MSDFIKGCLCGVGVTAFIWIISKCIQFANEERAELNRVFWEKHHQVYDSLFIVEKRINDRLDILEVKARGEATS